MSRRISPVIPGFGLTLGYTLVYLSLIVLIPLAAMFVHAAQLTWDQRNEHNQAEIHQGVAQCQPEAGYDGGDTTRHKSPCLTHEARKPIAGLMF